MKAFASSLVLALALASCGQPRSRAHGTAATTPTATSPAATTHAPAFAALFVDGATWSFAATTDGDAGSPSGTDDDAGTASTKVTCGVARYREVGDIKVSEIVCGDGWPTVSDSGDPLTGAWAMTATGTWRIDAFPAAGAEPALAEYDMLLAASPVPGTYDLGLATEGPSLRTIERYGDAWCVGDSIQAMYSNWWDSLCVDSLGPTSGAWGYEGDGGSGVKFKRATAGIDQ